MRQSERTRKRDEREGEVQRSRGREIEKDVRGEKGREGKVR